MIIICSIFIACSTKVIVKAIKPSAINDSSIKQVSILNFKNDDISLASSIESQMNKVIFNKKNYFKIINRKELDIILKEQKLQDSGLVNNANSSLGLSVIKSLVTGEINSATKSKKYFYENRTNYDRCLSYKMEDGKKNYCQKYAKYRVNCTKYFL